MVLVTGNITLEQLETSPFPHIVARNVLEPSLYRKLRESLPPLDQMLKGKKYGPNERLNYSATNIAYNPQIASVWKEFAQAHLNQPFLTDFVRLFGNAISRDCPDFEERFGNPSELKAGIRGVDEASDADVFLDFQIGVNTPSLTGGTTVRAPHIDCPKKLFVGLLYIRLEGDESTGGDLEIYQAKNNPLMLDETRTARIHDVEVVKTIPYEDNVLVLFLNSPNSLHGVTPRSSTPCHRVFINLLGEMREPLFKLQTKQLLAAYRGMRPKSPDVTAGDRY
jgi:hypothetical protein